MKYLFILIFLGFSLAGIAQSYDSALTRYMLSIEAKELKKHLEVLASDGFEGRAAGERGQKLAANYIASFFESVGTKTPNDSSYYQPFTVKYDSLGPKKRENAKGDIITENVIAIIEGKELKEECIVISAHYDHLGKRIETEWIEYGEGDSIRHIASEREIVFNGADDDGSGTVALLEIAEAFMQAKKDGYAPRRTIIITAFTAEEFGLWGSKYYVSHPHIPLKNTIANLNIDMIGRTDEKHKDSTHYVYVIGSDKLSSELKKINEEANKKYTRLQLDYSFDINDDQKYYYRSDHYNFAKNNVPIIFYFNGTHEDYHKETDELHKINYDLLEKRTRLVFCTAWELANRENRIQVDKLKGRGIEGGSH